MVMTLIIITTTYQIVPFEALLVELTKGVQDSTVVTLIDVRAAPETPLYIYVYVYRHRWCQTVIIRYGSERKSVTLMICVKGFNHTGRESVFGPSCWAPNANLWLRVTLRLGLARIRARLGGREMYLRGSLLLCDQECLWRCASWVDNSRDSLDNIRFHSSSPLTN